MGFYVSSPLSPIFKRRKIVDSGNFIVNKYKGLAATRFKKKLMNPNIKESKTKELERRMVELGIRAEDLVEKFIHGSGRGGQKLNKTANCVFLKHIPTGISVKVQRSRSREVNRFLARRELCDRIEELEKGIESKRKKREFKIRKQKARRGRRAKAKMLENKHKQAEKKASRKRVEPENE